MHITKFSPSTNTKVPSSSSSTATTTTTTTTTNIEQYQHPSVLTLRRGGRPTNIDIPVFDHHNTSQSNDLGIYSAPLFYRKPTSENAQQHVQHSSHPYTSSLPYRAQQSPSHPTIQQHNVLLYQAQQQPAIINTTYSQHQYTPHTFPLPASPNHHQYFHFPPAGVTFNITNNGHPSTNTSQPATPTPNNHLCSTQKHQPQWSNPVLSPLLVKRINENPRPMAIVNNNNDDDDDDPSASIDALVADVDINSSDDLLDDDPNKSIGQAQASSSSHMYLRSESHILTTPPNPLASDDHPDNQLTVGTNFQKTFSPISSAGFELSTNNNMQLASTNGKFTFDTNILEQTRLENQPKRNLMTNTDDDDQDLLAKPLIINTDIRSTRIPSNNLIQDDNSNHSSTNSSSNHQSSRMFGQMLKSSEKHIRPSSSPLSNDINQSLNLDNNSMSMQQTNRHCCLHPGCAKTFTNKSALAKHKLTHSQDRKHVCTKCNKGFKRLDHLNGHMLTHEEEKPHKCRVPDCNRTYCDARSLKRHIENTHQDILEAIHLGLNDEYKNYLPETAFVKTKDLSAQNEFLIDSVETNSPHSSTDNEHSSHVQTSSGTRHMITYTFDEEKSIECQICKKSFKNGAALNGHMRLHGGFNEKQPSSTDNPTKKKRTTTATATTKRKRTESSSTPLKVKTEQQDIPVPTQTKNIYQQQASYLGISPKHYHSRSESPSAVARTTFSPYLMNNSPSPHSSIGNNINPASLSANTLHPSAINISNMILPLEKRTFQMFSNARSPLQQYEDKLTEQMSNPAFVQHNQTSRMPINSEFVPVLPQNTAHIQPNISPSNPSAFFQRLLAASVDPRNGEIQILQPSLSHVINEASRYTPPTVHFIPTSTPNAASLIINTPSSSPFSNSIKTTLLSQVAMCNTIPNTTTTRNNSTQHSSPAPPSVSSINVFIPERHITLDVSDTTQQTSVENPLSTSTIADPMSDADSPKKKTISGFLIGTPSSVTSLSASSSASSHTHFNYDPVPPPSKNQESTSSPFVWPSQLRRQLSLNLATKNCLENVPMTPYTPPPMLSPFRKGPGLYYRVFSHPGTSVEPSSIPTTPILPCTPGGEESSGPKINIGEEYQARVPKFRTAFHHDDDTTTDDELLFSPTHMSCLDEKALEKFEQLFQINPSLFSSRQSTKSYSIELVYMLLHEYNGDLGRTLTALIEGNVNDIKPCRPLYSYHFPDCDTWTKEEIEMFGKAFQPNDINFEAISRSIGTKSVKQCIEFYYMPKVNGNSRKRLPASKSSMVTRRQRFQMNKAKPQFDDDISSSSPFNELRLDDDGSTMNSDSSPVAVQYSCDIAECLQTFTSERAGRAHRKNHRRTHNNMTTSTNAKRN